MKFAYASGSRPLDGYTIKRGVGAGGFGEVYFAVSDGGKEVALKRIQRHLDVEIRGVSQCLNLKHPNLIGLYDIKYNDEGEGWVVMEYVNGETLKDVIDRHPHGMPPEEVNRWFQGVAAGVLYLHDHGIVHRDLKPGNIFLDEEGVKIGDYGLSKFISCSRRSGQTESVGTFHYMAPEIGKGVYGKEIDIYALGVILYEMITGHVPFDGESSQEIIMKHLTADPDLSGVEEPHRGVIRRALLKDPQKRFSSVEQMLVALDLREGERPRRGRFAEAPVAAAVVADGGAEEEIPLGQGPQAGSPPAASRPGASAQEPIAEAVGAGWKELVHWWRHANLSTPVKLLLVFAAVFMAAAFSPVWIRAAVTLAVIYLIYRAVRGLILALKAPAKSAPPPVATESPFAEPADRPAAPARHHAASPQSRRHQARHHQAWQKLARRRLHDRPAAQRLGELTGSLLMAAVVAAVVALLMLLIGGQPLEGVQTWSLFVWITLTSVAAAWAILAVAKLWEGGQGDPVRRRFALLVLGLLLGVASFGLHELLLVDVGKGVKLGLFSARDMPPSMYGPGGTPLLPAYLVFFAGLLAILCWWKQADPLRTTRLSLWTTFVSALWGWILPFPQPWGCVLAATISIAVQLSGPWMGADERTRIRREAREI